MTKYPEDEAQRFLAEAHEVADLEGDCRRRKVGAVVVVSGVIVGRGASGIRPGSGWGCLAGACPRGLLSYDEIQANQSSYSDPSSPGYCISMHAEVRATLNALQWPGNRFGLDRCWIFVTAAPCPECDKFIFNSGLAGYSFVDVDGILQQVAFN